LEAVLSPATTEADGEAVPVSGAEVPDERTLVSRAQSGNTAAFEALYRAQIDRVYGLCLRMTGNASEAEDCAQEAFIQAWKQLAKFRGDSAFGTWMHRVAVNAVLGRMRKSRREQDRIQAMSESGLSPATVGDTGGLRDLQDAMDRLPSGAKHVFVLHAVYGYSHDETGEMLGIAAGTSKAQMHRARRLLVQQLDKSDGA
jgi:RNA polymerase sigma-70 factor (ECF subfamily)